MWKMDLGSKQKGRSIIAALLIVMMVLGSLPLSLVDAADEVLNITAGVQVSKTVSKTVVDLADSISANKQISLNYTVNFDDIPGTSVNVGKDKEVVLVIDTSGSMAFSLGGAETNVALEDQRMTIIKEAANTFLDKLSADQKIKISLIDFNNRATVHTFSEDGATKTQVNLSNKLQTLKDRVDDLTPGGGTNIGDALRRANEILNTSSTADKYVVFLSDGEPTAFSVQSISYNSTSSYYANGAYYVNDYLQGYSSSIRNATYYTGTGNTSKYYVNYGSTTDSGSHSKTYSKNMTKVLADNGITAHYIGFTLTSNAKDNILHSSLVNPSYYTATTAADINQVYNRIADQIVSEVKIPAMTFEEVFPQDMTIVSVPDGFVQSGLNVTKNFGEVVFKYNSTKKAYEAPAVQFTIVVAPEKAGDFELGKNNTSKLMYTDINLSSKQLYFPMTKITAVSELSDRRSLKILEVQPQRKFELSLSKLQTTFSDYGITLHQVSMTELVGMVDEINGLYDIVYIGQSESYNNLQMIGKNTSNSNVTFSYNVDITDRKAADVLSFIQSGQTMFFDDGVFALAATSKIRTNFDGIKNLSNVTISSSVTDNFYANMLAEYRANQHRPRLTIKSNPTEYDETSGSYMSNHMMSYLYSAYTNSNTKMSLELYLDFNGDGVFLADEKATVSSVNQNTSDLALNYTLEDDFNGLMPWKLVLVDETTKAKDYQVGYTAFKGKKTIVNVLQLTPGTDRINLADTTKFKLPLDTADYKINITYLPVTLFDSNYPNPVSYGGKTIQTDLNGFYDMVIIGFGDSYSGSINGSSSNRDIKNQAAVDGLKDFISTGQSVMFTHDTAGPQDKNNTERNGSNKLYNDIVTYNDAPNITENFKIDMGFANLRTEAGKKNWTAWGSNSAYKLNEGLITRYPYILANNSTSSLAIAGTHDQYWKINLEDDNVVPWFTLNQGNLKYYPEAYYYTFTHGNITYSGTGHSSPEGVEEQELFVNTMLKASRGANHAPTMELFGLYDNMNISPSQEKIEFKIKISDVDYLDQLFTTRVYLVYQEGGVQKKVEVFEKPDMVKDQILDVSFEKPDEPGTAITDFVIQVEVEDPKGAKGVEEVDVTHYELPTPILSDNSRLGYLVGDTIDLQYTVGAKSEAEKALINNIRLQTDVNSSLLQMISYSNWSKSGNRYSVNPNYTTLSAFGLTMKALAAGSANLSLSGLYDTKIVQLDQPMKDVSISHTTPIDIKVGVINVEIKDQLARAVKGTTVWLKDASGNILKTAVTGVTGLATFTGASSSTFTVEVDRTTLPVGIVATGELKSSVVMNYSNYNQTISFVAKDMTPPVITTSYDRTILMPTNTKKDVEVYVKFDGMTSKITKYWYKKISATGATAATFEGANAGTNVALTTLNAVSTDPANQLALIPDVLEPKTADDTDKLSDGRLQYGSFKVTENGIYAIYAMNEAGNVTVTEVNITNIIKELPDGI